MANPELSRRVDRHGEDITALSDTVVTILETVQQHTSTLAELRQDVTALKETVGRHSVILDQHTGALADLRRDVSVLKGDMVEVKGTLGEILGLLRQGR